MNPSQERGFTISNSQSKCLLENWVEERSSKPYDEGKTDKDVYRQGHMGLLTVTADDPAQVATTYRSDYIEMDLHLPQRKYVGHGCKRDYLVQMFTQKAIDHLKKEEEEAMRRQVEERLQSETAAAFWKQNKLQCKPNFKEHDLTKEQPITFWTEHAKRITGQTKVPNGTIDSPFRKNASFSKPIGERYDDWACDYK